MLAHDTSVRVRSPWLAAVLCVVTLGVVGAVRHGKVNGELRRFGRARGAMTFPFIRASPGVSVVAWVLGLVGYVVVIATIVGYVQRVASGRHDFDPGDISSLSFVLLLLTPLWLTALHTARRIRTAQHLVGIVPPPTMTWWVTALTVVFPPIGTWRMQLEVNRAWNVWRAT